MINVKKFAGFSDKCDRVLLICSILASIIGILIINSATYTLPSHTKFVTVQSVALILGIAAMSGLMLFNYKNFEKLRYIIFAAGIGLLILVLAIGKLTHGTQGWIVIGPITLQPSEVAKVCFILTLSYHVSVKYESINSPKTLLFLFIHFMCYALPVLLQPDFGTASVFAIIFALSSKVG